MAVTVFASGNVDPELLWTNPNPTADFVASKTQTFAMDLSRFDSVLVVPYLPTEKDRMGVSIANVGGYGTIARVFNDTMGANGYARGYKVNENGITFYPAYGQGTMTGTTCKPYKIYGLVGFTAPD